MNYTKEEMRNMLSNPLFRAANEQLCKFFEKELRTAEAEERLTTYLKDNPRASFAKVVMETGVDMKVIEDLIADGRIDIKISQNDRDTLRELQEQVMNNLSTIGNVMRNDKERNASVQATIDADKKATGMYSKKDGKLK